MLLTGGLPFHRRTDERMLDSLLLVRGERSRSFELGIGLDVKYPLHEAMALLAPPTMIPRTCRPTGGICAGLDVSPGPAERHGHVLDAARPARTRGGISRAAAGDGRRTGAHPVERPIARSTPRTK